MAAVPLSLPPPKNHHGDHSTPGGLGYFHLRILGPSAPLLLLRSDRLYSLSFSRRRGHRLRLLASPARRYRRRRRRDLLVSTSGCVLRLSHCFPGAVTVRVNGLPLHGGGGGPVDLAVGDEVSLLLLGVRYGFVAEKFVSCERGERSAGSCEEVIVLRAESLRKRLRAISESQDPLSFLRDSHVVVKKVRVDGDFLCQDSPIEPVPEENLRQEKCNIDQDKLEHQPDVGEENTVSKKEDTVELPQRSEGDFLCQDSPINPVPEEELRQECNLEQDRFKHQNDVAKENTVSKKEDTAERSKGYNNDTMDHKRCSNGNIEQHHTEGRYSDGSTFFLNRLSGIRPEMRTEQESGVTLPELLHPVSSLLRVFVATFTSDVSWFLEYCKIPQLLPVTIACHNKDRCWSASRESRAASPFENHPNLLLVYPRFPEEIAFGKDRKKQGVACHHPKLIVLQREDSMRVIISSANLVPRQWHLITNTVWWQDFPRRTSSDYSALFSTVEEPKSDFAAQLVSFIGSLIHEVPSQAYWINEIAKYDFEGAGGYLVASVPGLYMPSPCYLESTYCLSANRILHTYSARRMFLGSVQTSVVGLSHRFHMPSDAGSQLKSLSVFLGKCHENVHGTAEVILKRNANIPADANAVSVLVADLDKFSEEDSVQLGFLPREVAKWVSPLSDMGFFKFSGFIYPREALEAAFGVTNTKVQLLLYVSKGPEFSRISGLIRDEHLPSLCSLVASLKKSLGLWRLEEVLSRFKWPETLETDFMYSASSIGTSINSQFIAHFASATGKRSNHDFDSEESDPEWGCWTARHELKKPSISLLFPTIERVKTAACGIQLSRFLISLREKTWQRLRSTGILHDAVPHPHDRIGHPMHVKVVQRRFRSRKGGHSFGWTYCGSHNFSPAAWGQPLHPPSKTNTTDATRAAPSGPRLHICNYELGIILIAPPPGVSKKGNGRVHRIDGISLPFVIPAPRYKHNDRPATPLAMREAMAEACIPLSNDLSEETDEDIADEDDELVVELSDCSPEEKEEEKIYAETLWGQVDSSQSQGKDT